MKLATMSVTGEYLLTLLLLLLLPANHRLVSSQGIVDGTAVQCFSDLNCPNSSTLPDTTKRECCVGNGRSFSVNGTCHSCVVLGWLYDTFTGDEGDTRAIEVGFKKYDSTALSAYNLDIQIIQGNTTSDDIALVSSSIRVLTGENGTLSVTFQADDVSLELVEEFQLVLSFASTVSQTLRDDAVLLNTIRIFIQDKTSIQIEFSEDDFQASEAVGSATVVISKNREVASPLTLRITPMTTAEAEMMGIAPQGIPEDDAFKPNKASPADFNTSSITVKFNRDEGNPSNTMETQVMVIDDLINEASEQVYIVRLEVVSPTNEDLIQVTKFTSIIRIIDNDMIRIGFEKPNYTFTEQNVTHDNVIFLVKEDNVISEQTFGIVIEDTEISATRNIDYSIDYKDPVLFEPNVQRQPLNITLFHNAIFELAETFLIRSSGSRDPKYPTYSAPGPVGITDTTTVIIQDDYPVKIGFVETEYSIDEGDIQLVCVNMFEPPSSDILGDLLIVVMVTSESQIKVPNELVFTDDDRLECFNVSTSIDGIVKRDHEMFSMNLHHDPSRPIPRNILLDPNISNFVIIEQDRVTVGFLTQKYNVTEDKKQIMFQIGVIKGELGFPFTLSFQTHNGTAKDKLDFLGKSTSVTLTGTGSTSVNVTIIQDTLFDSKETFTATLSPKDSHPRVTVDPSMATVVISDVIEPVRVNDTVTGDPLMTVPLNLQNKDVITEIKGDETVNLCFEVHGDADEIFNLVSDGCVSVNAHYSRVRPNEDLNIIDAIYVRAVDNSGMCHNIAVELDGCSASVDDSNVTTRVFHDGVSVKRYRNRVRIAVPNCGELDLIMWVFCTKGQFYSRSFNKTESFEEDMIRFVIARGINLNETSHGIIGQFWNIPVDVKPFEGDLKEGSPSDPTYVITTRHPGAKARSFVGFLSLRTWERVYEYCLYVGDSNGGQLDEVVRGPNDPVIQGSYKEYIVGDRFLTYFDYTQFNEDRCVQ